MKIFIAKETATAETRVAASPETVKKLIALGATVTVASGAGAAASFTDDMYKAAGAAIGTPADADIILCVRAPDDSSAFKRGALLIGMLAPYQNKDKIKAYASQGLTAVAMELVPRITRAQAMDVLSSQASLAGYRAVLEASYEFSRGFPLMMTAAGTVPAAKVFVMGAGVAGLQAIATARRLGAQVSATDVRAAAKEQVESLGATFVWAETGGEGTGGYAKELSDEDKQKQAALVAETIKKQDIVITTALIPGKKAPVLVSAEMVQSMKPGAVIVDLAAEAGGNCALTKPGEVATMNGVTIVGHLNLPGRIATDASALYARNLLSFLTTFFDKEKKAVILNPDDEIVKAACLARDGAVIHPGFQ